MVSAFAATERREELHWRATVSSTTPHRGAGTVLSEHRTSMGLVRYRRWESSITVELLPLDEPPAILAVLAATRPPATDPLAQAIPADDARS